MLGSILNGFLAAVRNIWNGLSRIFNGIIDFIRGVFTGDWDRAWNGVKDIFGGVFDALVGLAKAPLNLIIGLLNGAIGAINGMINGLNRMSFPAPDWVPIFGGKSWGVNIPNIPSIPYLASGGIVSSGQMFVAREAGPELVGTLGGHTAVANNDQIVEGIAAGVRSANVDMTAAIVGALNLLIREVQDIDPQLVQMCIRDSNEEA